MHSVFSDPVLAAYALSAAAVVIILYALGFETARIRAARKVVVNPEDAGINGGAAVAEVEHADVLRIKRAHLNSLENAVPFLAIGLLYTMTAPGPTTARVVFGVFVLARLLHAAFYLTARQPFRTLVFVIGALCNLFMVVQVLRAALAA